MLRAVNLGLSFPVKVKRQVSQAVNHPMLQAQKYIFG